MSPQDLTEVSISSVLGSWPSLSVQGTKSSLLGHLGSHSLLRSCYSQQSTHGPGTDAYYPKNLKHFFPLLVLWNVPKTLYFPRQPQCLESLRCHTLASIFFPSLAHSPVELRLWQEQKPGEPLSHGELGTSVAPCCVFPDSSYHIFPRCLHPGLVSEQGGGGGGKVPCLPYFLLYF